MVLRDKKSSQKHNIYNHRSKMSHSLKVVGESKKRMYGPMAILVCGFSSNERKIVNLNKQFISFKDSTNSVYIFIDKKLNFL